MTTTAKLSDTRYSPTRINALGDKISTVGLYALKASTITVLGWIGAMKYTPMKQVLLKGLLPPAH